MRTNKKIIRVMIAVCVMFLSLVTYLLYFNMFQAEEVSTNPYNKRQWEDEKYVKRGNIFSKDGTLLAETVVEGEFRLRRYPYGRLYSHIIGYCSPTYGKSQLEMSYDKQLLGHGDIALTFNELRSGYDLTLTLDHGLQEYAYSQLDGRNGAIVALEPSTGKILAMVSYPDFDPNSDALERSWSSIVEREDSPLLARATQGLYPPGSTYKIATAAAAWEAGRQGETFQDTGQFVRDDLRVDNYGGSAYGEIDVKEGFALSSNFVFCSLGYELGAETVLENARNFGVGREIPLEISTTPSEIGYREMTASDAALVSIGQGQLLMSPLHVAMMAAAVANHGVMMQPCLVESVSTGSGLTISSARPQVLWEPFDAACARYLDDLMREAVAEGTGKSSQISGVAVAGKTGTAENESGRDHAWFAGYAPADAPVIAVAVLLESDGNAGGVTAGPIARNVMQYYLDISGAS